MEHSPTLVKYTCSLAKIVFAVVIQNRPLVSAGAVVGMRVIRIVLVAGMARGNQFSRLARKGRLCGTAGSSALYQLDGE